MKREDVARVFQGATEEQISALLDINSQDIGRAKRIGERLQADLQAANAALEKAGAVISALQENREEVERLRGEVEQYRQAQEARARKEEAAGRQADIQKRFDAVSAGNAFVHEYVRRGVLEEFARAIEEQAGQGKTDEEIFTELTRDQNCFASQNPPPDMPPMGEADSGRVSDQEAFRALPLYEQFLFARRDPQRTKKYLEE